MCGNRVLGAIREDMCNDHSDIIGRGITNQANWKSRIIVDEHLG